MGGAQSRALVQGLSVTWCTMRHVGDGDAAGELTLDQALNRLGGPLSGGFSSGNHDCQSGAHTKMEPHAPGGVHGALGGARACETGVCSSAAGGFRLPEE